MCGRPERGQAGACDSTPLDETAAGGVRLQPHRRSAAQGTRATARVSHRPGLQRGGRDPNGRPPHPRFGLGGRARAVIRTRHASRPGDGGDRRLPLCGARCTRSRTPRNRPARSRLDIDHHADPARRAAGRAGSRSGLARTLTLVEVVRRLHEDDTRTRHVARKAGGHAARRDRRRRRGSGGRSRGPALSRPGAGTSVAASDDDRVPLPLTESVLGVVHHEAAERARRPGRRDPDGSGRRSHVCRSREHGRAHTFVSRGPVRAGVRHRPHARGGFQRGRPQLPCARRAARPTGRRCGAAALEAPRVSR